MPAVSTDSSRKPSRKSEPQSEFGQVKKRRPFTVFLVVDDQSTREAIATTLRNQKITVQDYMTGMEFYRDYRKPVPGLLISEVFLRDMSGLELYDKLKADKSKLVVEYLATNSNVPHAIRGMQSGAIDFLVKPFSEERLIDAVARAYGIHYDVDHDFIGEDLDEIEAGMKRISSRQKEVLELVIQGHTTREIAESMGISPKTADIHRSSIANKLRSKDLGHLVRMATAYYAEHPMELSRG